VGEEEVDAEEEEEAAESASSAGSMWSGGRCPIPQPKMPGRFGSFTA